jgi:hypothetical protein
MTEDLGTPNWAMRRKKSISFTARFFRFFLNCMTENFGGMHRAKGTSFTARFLMFSRVATLQCTNPQTGHATSRLFLWEGCACPTPATRMACGNYSTRCSRMGAFRQVSSLFHVPHAFQLTDFGLGCVCKRGSIPTCCLFVLSVQVTCTLRPLEPFLLRFVFMLVGF